MFELHTNPDGLGWRAIIDWNIPPNSGKCRNKRWPTHEAASNAAAARLHMHNQVCTVVPVGEFVFTGVHSVNGFAIVGSRKVPT